LGTLIGAVAGGAKGAVVGAAAGAAAGAGAQVATKGKEVRVPAESQLTFKLDEPIMLQEYNP
jgi:outer membrane lipoprotein SlyB